MTDWGSLFLATLTGACLGWMVCSLWTMRWINSERRRISEMRDALEQATIDQYELRRLQEQERFNRERA